MFFNCCLLFQVLEVERISWEALQSWPSVSITVTISQPLSWLMLVLQSWGTPLRTPKELIYISIQSTDIFHIISDAGRRQQSL